MLHKTSNRHIHVLAVGATLMLMIMVFVAMVAFSFSFASDITRGQWITAMLVQFWLLSLIVGLAYTALRIHQRMGGNDRKN